MPAPRRRRRRHTAALGQIGISGLCNLVASIKTARYYDMDGRDVIFTPLTDSMELYASRMQEMDADARRLHTHLADQHFRRYLQGTTTDHLRELNYADQKALHNFKYFTWVEQQGRSSDELRSSGTRISGRKCSHRMSSMNGIA